MEQISRSVILVEYMDPLRDLLPADQETPIESLPAWAQDVLDDVGAATGLMLTSVQAVEVTGGQAAAGDEGDSILVVLGATRVVELDGSSVLAGGGDAVQLARRPWSSPRRPGARGSSLLLILS